MRGVSTEERVELKDPREGVSFLEGERELLLELKLFASSFCQLFGERKRELLSFVSPWALRGQRVRERALVTSEGRTEVEPAASRTCRERVRGCRGDTCCRDQREPVDLQGSRDFFISFYLGIECVWCVRPRP